MKARLLAGALATALLVAGCATVPTKGPIRNSSQDAPAPGLGGIGVEARPPRPNAPQQQLVNGFVEAMSDSNAFDVAREYMTPEAGDAWKPESKILVYDQSSSSGIAREADGKFHLSAPLIATIDSRGSWAPAPSDTQLDFAFDLTKVGDQWRVANPPPGVFLGSNQLVPRLTPYALYFFNPSKHLMVPDPVYLPRNLPSGQAATQLIQELLKGPTTRLGNSVVSNAPPGTTVDVSVPVESGVATVALSGTASSLTDATDREQLAAQITWTLQPITTRVRITVEGAPLLPDRPEELSYHDFTQYDPAVPSGRLKDLYGVRAGRIQRIQGQDDGQTIEAKPIADSQLYPFRAESFAVNLHGETGAVVSTSKAGRPIVVVGRLDAPKAETPPSVIEADGKVLRPSFDGEDNLWILDRADSAKPRLRVRTADGKVSNVLTSFGANRLVVLRMAPDGVRALLVMERNGVNSVMTASVASSDGKPALGRFMPLQLPLVDITDATWNNPGILLAGSSPKRDGARPWQVNVDGSQPQVIPGASSSFETIHVASNPNHDTLPAVQDAQKQLHWQGKDLNWVDMAEGPEGLITPVYPG
ncbi:LpqB family beta-propeller domain-containing protein [Kribbella sp. NPDC051718]|uniref:LpqB family beta-propeller domain-containing protein n=1 Tax=Kribbella sp. NPDC051718 TaxID=3155168 RepID=UPI003441E693